MTTTTTNSAKPVRPRYESIDLLRGTAVIIMVVVHFVENLSPPTQSGVDLRTVVSQWVGGRAGAFFTMASGLTYYLWLRKQISGGRTDGDITRVTIRRGLFLFGLGIAFNTIAWLPDETFNWDVLTLIGSGYVVLALVRHLPKLVLIALCGIVLLVSPLLRIVTSYNECWEGETYVYDPVLTEVVFGFFANGFFPILPWIVFPIAGFLLAGALWTDATCRVSARAIAGVSIVLLAAAILSVVGFHLLLPVECRPFFDAFRMFPATTPYVLGSLGGTSLAIVALHVWMDRATTSRGVWPLEWVKLFGSFSLTMYVLHHIVHLWPMWLLATHEGRAAKHYWQNAAPPGIALSLGLGFLVGGCFVLSWLRRHPSMSIEALMRWLCD